MPTDEEPTVVENDLLGGNDVCDPRWATYYVLAVKDDAPGFYRVDNNGDGIDSHTAFLLNPSLDADVEMIALSFDDVTGIKAFSPCDGEAIVSECYAPGGQSIGEGQRGLNIVRMSDGTVRKVLVR